MGLQIDNDENVAIKRGNLVTKALTAAFTVSGSQENTGSINVLDSPVNIRATSHDAISSVRLYNSISSDPLKYGLAVSPSQTYSGSVPVINVMDSSTRFSLTTSGSSAGISEFYSEPNFSFRAGSGAKGGVRISGSLHVSTSIYDTDNSRGTAGQVLSSTVTGSKWVAASSGAKGEPGAQGPTGAGPQGAAGAKGQKGEVGEQSGLLYAFSTSTDMAGADGQIRFNNATIGSSTQISLALEDSDGVNHNNLWAKNSQLLIYGKTAGDIITVASYSINTVDATRALLDVSAADVQAAGTFSNSEDVRIQYVENGTKGQKGATGTGTQGPAGAGDLEGNVNHNIVTMTGTNAISGSAKFTYNGAGDVHLEGKLQIDQQTLTPGNTLGWAITAGSNAEVTLDASSNTLTMTGWETGDTGVLVVKQDSTGGRSINIDLSGNTVYLGNTSYTPSQGANAVDVLGWYYDGSKWYVTIGYGDAATTGAQGASGAQGTVGTKGITGAQGSDGTKGEKGEVGAQGDAGAKGDAGAQGGAGAKGDAGAQGGAGAKGDAGAQGEAGAKGGDGAQGEAGAKGDRGPQGTAGAKGGNGDKGGPGEKGGPGAKGEPGANGPQGTVAGPQGTDGAKGATGGTGAEFTMTNGSNDRVVTATGAAGINGEANMIFDGDNLTLSTGALHVGSGVTPTTVGKIQATNDIVAYYSSDARLKSNVVPIPDALNKVMQISGNTFDWIPLSPEQRKTIHGNEGKDIGVIAQEIERVLPEVVTTRDTGFKAVKYDKIVALLIEAIKEQQIQIDQLKNG